MKAHRLVSTKDLSRAEWLQYRAMGIGGTDASAIIGVNPWQGPVSVYLEKTGQKELETDFDPDAEERMYWGTILEDTVATEFHRRTGLKTRRVNAVLQHPAYPWMLANVDREIVKNKEEGPGILECKTTGSWGAAGWEDGDVPESYYVQVQHYMMVTGYDYAYLAVLIGGQKFKYTKIMRDDEFIEQLFAVEKNFWETHVEAGVMPFPDGSDDSSEAIKNLFPKSQENTLIELPEVEMTVSEYDMLKQEEKRIQERLKELQQSVQIKMGVAEKALAGTYEVSWKSVNSRRLNTKRLREDKPEIYEQYTEEKPTRRFTVKQKKQEDNDF